MMADEATQDWSKLTVAELKSELASRNLPIGGLKKDLVARLEEASMQEADENPEDMTETSENVIDTVGFEDNNEEEQDNVEDCANMYEECCEEEKKVEMKESEQNGEECQESTEVCCDDTNEKKESTEHHEEVEMKQKDGEEQEDVQKDSKTEEETKGEEDQQEEEEEVNMEDMVAVDETHGDEEEDDFSHLVDDMLDDKGRVDMNKLMLNDDEKMPLPPAPMQKWIFSTYTSGRNSCILCVSELTAKDVLCPCVVEWANRAMYFCINHNKEGKGTAMLHFTSSAECAEAKEALQQGLGEDVKINHPGSTSATDDEIKKKITYHIEAGSTLRSRLLFIEDAPKDTTIEQISSVFADSLLVLRLEHDDQVETWEGKEYVFPEDIVQKNFVVEFSNSDTVNKLLKDENKPELDGNKLTIRKMSEVEDDYKRYHARKLREARDKKWETLEQKKKEDIGEVVLSDKERFRLYKNIIALNKVKNGITRDDDKSYEDKVLVKETIIVRIFDITKKLDADTDRRLKADLLLPELPRYMTKHTKDKYSELSHEIKKKMQREAEDIFDDPRRSKRQERSKNRAIKRHSQGGGHGGRSGRNDRTSRGPPPGRDNRRDDRRGRNRDTRDRGRDRRSSDFGRRDHDRQFNRQGWRSPDRGDPKRRRTDFMDDRRRSPVPDVASQLKGLTEVISYKMNEIERLAGGMKARERALEDAFNSFGRNQGPPMQGGGSFQNAGYSNAPFNSGGPPNNMMGGGGFQNQGNFGGATGGGGGHYANMPRSGMSNLDRRRGGDVDDRYTGY